MEIDWLLGGIFAIIFSLGIMLGNWYPYSKKVKE